MRVRPKILVKECVQDRQTNTKRSKTFYKTKRMRVKKRKQTEKQENRQAE